MAKSLAKSGALVGIEHSAEQQRGRRASVARDLQNTKFQFAEAKMCLSAHRAPIALSPGRKYGIYGGIKHIIRARKYHF